jgi:cyclopropane fatty-acyl-phospholipid synthase-like methyltransferase
MKPNNDNHYDHVTDAWQDIMGNNFHFGYFNHPDDNLQRATDALIDKMSDLAHITENTTILDVGCGIGSPAMYLSEKYNCSVCGIATSVKGVETARNRVQSNGKKLEFKVADGTSNGEPSDNYDIVWVMESSHLMDKKALLRECYRVLKPKGTILLCDLIFVYDEMVANIINLVKSSIKYTHRGVFGTVRPWPLGHYWKTMHKMGFNDITTLDISKEVFPTMSHWKKNIAKNSTEILRTNKYTEKEISAFFQSCDRLEEIFNSRFVGYAIIKAIKL